MPPYFPNSKNSPRRLSIETRDLIFSRIRELVLCHSPSGDEAEVDSILNARFKELGLEPYSDPAGNLIAKIHGRGKGTLAITAHKDEIGAIVKSVRNDGRIEVRKLGGSFPWVYGEGVVDILGDSQCISGVLSFGSRHVTHASPQFAQRESAPVKWADVWIETKLSAAELAQAGVRPGSRVVVGKHRKTPLRLGNHIASYTLDNKASLVILLELARRLREPEMDIYLVASSKEEVGGVGGLYFTHRQAMDALIALEIAPLAPEYAIEDGPSPVLLAEDGTGPYDVALNRAILDAAATSNIPLQLAVIGSFASDASHSMKLGHVPRGACLGFATQNTHGYEIAHLGAIENCVTILHALCQRGPL